MTEGPTPIRPAGPRRRTSVQLSSRRGEHTSDARLMDPATRSLADALRVTFRLLQLGMLVLLVLFLLSGFQSIGESERGIRLIFGRHDGRVLESGFRFSFPYPIGDLVRVKTGTEQLDLSTEFWYSMQGRDPSARPEQHARSGMNRSLKPGRDGSLITGDRYLVHTRWKVGFRRSDPGQWVRAMHPDHEAAIVRAAAQRGIVHAVAETPIEQLLKQTEGSRGTVAERARIVAQAALDRIDSGLTIEAMTLTERIPPLFVYNDYARVTSAAANAAAARDQARSEGEAKLTATAGLAAPLLIRQIDAYEQALLLGDLDAQTRIFQTITALLEGRPVEIEGQLVEGITSGTVSQIISQAQQYRSSVVGRRRADLELFRAKLAQFRANPLVALHREWADARRAFAEHDWVQQVLVPTGASFELVVNQDPDIVRELERAQREEENRRAVEERRRLREQERFRTDTSTRTLSAEPGG